MSYCSNYATLRWLSRPARLLLDLVENQDIQGQGCSGFHNLSAITTDSPGPTELYSACVP